MSLSEQNRALIERARGISVTPCTTVAEIAVTTREVSRLLDAARAEGSQVGMERPPGAGWSEVPTQEAAHPERLSAEELRLTGAALSEWAWDHLAKGYGTSLTVREVSRLIQAVRATVEAATSAQAEGVAALQQGGEPISRENLEAELRETIGLYVREAVTRMFSEENATYRCARQIAGMLQPGYYLHRKLFSSPLPQQTALVEQGVEIAAFLIEQDDEPLAADLGVRMNYWRDKCITAGQRLDPKRWGPK